MRLDGIQLKIGDIVKTKVPGFGTGKTSKMGTVIDTREFVQHGKAGAVWVMHEDGSFLEWYPWQLENINV
jgi:hypothetical protein|tara:strand:- start:76 stop:285 length:210 start_codon:yes stop_codon:yes gene_type:complete